MKRAVFVLALCIMCSACWAQAGPAMGAKSPQQENGFMSWVHGAWKTVQEQGRPAVERMAKEWPQRFRAIKQQVADLTKTIHERITAMDLAQKRDMALELWRVRRSLDMMTLLKPDVLHSLTGLDTAGLTSLETQVQKMSDFVHSQMKAH